jgi:hypothetical protein
MDDMQPTGSSVRARSAVDIGVQCAEGQVGDVHFDPV